MLTRKLIRPTLPEMRGQVKLYEAAPRRRVPPPPDVTHAEEYYYIKQMVARTPMVIKLVNDEELRGVLEWYDKDCIKLTRIGAPNLLIPKRVIKYIYKQNIEESSAG